jgi:hypothetical protein
VLARLRSRDGESVGATVDHLVQALLALVAGVFARVTELWGEPMILWLALVGEPSSGKPPGRPPSRVLAKHAAE